METKRLRMNRLLAEDRVVKIDYPKITGCTKENPFQFSLFPFIRLLGK